MIHITNKQECCGCGACQQKCPKHCITMQRDSEGFLYPKVDVDKCINCGLCERICPVKNPFEKFSIQKTLAAINKNDKIRLVSSSGGIFSVLAEKIIRSGGIVFGARYDDEWQVVIDYTETLEGLSAFRESKYVQSRTGSSFCQCEKFLKAGKSVLYTGTPCQIAGLKHYLRTEYEHLYTCEIVCHGSPSPKVWNRYLLETISSDLSLIRSVHFRSKVSGWKEYSFVITYEKDESIREKIETAYQNLYMKAFLSNLILRPSCYNCNAKEGASHSDFTLADYWGVAKYHPDMDDDRGSSLLLVNTQKGDEFIDYSRLKYQESFFENAISHNLGLLSVAHTHPKRQNFFKALDSTRSITRLMDKYTKPTFSTKIKRFIARLKHKVKKILMQIGVV